MRVGLLARDRVSLPDVFESLGQGLRLHGTVGVAGVAREDELVVVTLVGEHLGEPKGAAPR